jgi:glycosyltransferase involved in cell wall biosynthesis
MRVCILAPEFIPNWGGTGAYLANLLKYLPQKVDLHVVTVRRTIAGQELSDQSAEEEISKSLGRTLTIHYLSSAQDTFLYNMGFQMSCLRELTRLCKRYEFDIIHSSHCHMPDLYYQFARRARVPTVVTVHDFLSVKRESIRNSGMEFERLDRSEKGILMLYPFLRLCELAYVKRMPAFIAPSQYVAGILKSHGVRRERINIVPNGIDTSVFSPKTHYRTSEQSCRPTVLFTGRLVSHKGIDTVLSSIPLVLRRMQGVQFVFTGAGMPAIYLNRVRDSATLQCIKFLGYIRDYFEMSKLYGRADVFILPSLFENCPLSLLEAMSSEVPVIATSVGGIPEIVTPGKNGILIRPHDSVALADSITSLLLDTKYATGLASEGRRTVVDRFSAERMANDTMRVYEAIAKR